VRGVATDAKSDRYLIATGGGNYSYMPEANLPGVKTDVERIASLFTRRFGYQRVSELGLNPTANELRLGVRGFFKHKDRRPTDIVVFYYTGHGEVLETNEHVLLAADADPDRAVVVHTSELARLMLEGSPVRQLLVLLDTCYAGRGGDDFAVRSFVIFDRPVADEVAQPGVVVVTATRPREVARSGLFVGGFLKAIGDLATGARAPSYLTVDAVVRVLNNRVPPTQKARISSFGALGPVPEFLPNPRHDARLVDCDLETQDTLIDLEEQHSEQEAARAAELQIHFVPRGRGVELETEPGWFFTGRHQALHELATWLSNPTNDVTTRVITGDPGSGKSAVLARLVLLAHPDYRASVPRNDAPDTTFPKAGVIDVAVHARGKTDGELLAALAAAGRMQARTVEDFIKELKRLRKPLVAVIDALDEASELDRVVDLVRQLSVNARPQSLRLLVGVRRHLVRPLGDSITILDLDAPEYLEHDDVKTYASRCLTDAHLSSSYVDADPERLDAVAKAVADAAGQSFLVARILGRALASEPVADASDPTWRASLPTTAGQALRRDLERLGPHAARAEDLLLPLVYAEGSGLPWEDLWAPLATAIAGNHAYTDDDIRWLRQVAGAYIVEGIADGRSVYRLYHQALIEHLRGERSEQEVQYVISKLLARHAPKSTDGRTTDWARAHPYTRTHLATHAAAAKMLDDFLVDPNYLLAAEPQRLLAALPAAQSTAAQAYRRAYRHRQRSFEGTTTAADLEYAACGAGASELADRIARSTLPRSWATWWVNHDVGSVTAVAVGEIDDRSMVITGSESGEIQIRDLADGTLRDDPIIPDSPMRPYSSLKVTGVAVSELEGRPVVVSGHDDDVLRVWDVATSDVIATHDLGRTPEAVAAATLEDRPVIVSGHSDGALRVWDVATGTAIGPAVYGHREHRRYDREGWVSAVAVGELHGRQVIVSGGFNSAVRVWDLATRTPVRPTLRVHEGGIAVVALGKLGARDVVIAGGYRSPVWVWETVGSRMATFRRMLRWWIPQFLLDVYLDRGWLQPHYVLGGRYKSGSAATVGRCGDHDVVVTTDHRTVEIWSEDLALTHEIHVDNLLRVVALGPRGTVIAGGRDGLAVLQILRAAAG
jgi:hypothetical protein